VLRPGFSPTASGWSSTISASSTSSSIDAAVLAEKALGRGGAGGTAMGAGGVGDGGGPAAIRGSPPGGTPYRGSGGGPAAIRGSA
jgi:hypothetical protein